jgi:hypothetical protein
MERKWNLIKRKADWSALSSEKGTSEKGTSKKGTSKKRYERVGRSSQYREDFFRADHPGEP